MNRSGGSCDRFDLLVRLSGLPVIAVELGDDGGLRTVELSALVVGCRTCGVVAHGPRPGGGPRPGRGHARGCAVGRSAGDGDVAQAAVGVPRAGMLKPIPAWLTGLTGCPCNLMRRMVGGVK